MKNASVAHEKASLVKNTAEVKKKLSNLPLGKLAFFFF